MAQIGQSKETSQDKTGASQQTSRAEESGHTTMPGADVSRVRSTIAASAVPSALNEVPIKNQAIINYAYKALGADSNYNFARQEVMKRFGVDLGQAESDRQGVSSIKLTKENGTQVQNDLIGRFKGFAGSEPASVAAKQPVSVIPRAVPVEEVPNQKLINHAYNVLKVEQRGIAAERDLKVMFGVNLDSLLANRNGTSFVEVRNGPAGNEAALKDVLNPSPAKSSVAVEPQIKTGKNSPTPIPAQSATPEIRKAIPVEEVSNQKLINHAYRVLKVEERGIVAERQFKATFGVELDSLLKNRSGTSTIEVKNGPGGNEAALRQVLNPSTATSSVASESHAKKSEPASTARADLKSEKAKAEQVQSVTGKDIARLYEKTADALTDLLGGGRAGRAAAATFLGAKGTSDRALEEAIAQKVGSRYIATGYDPVSLRGQYRNSQFGVDRYHIGEMTQDLQKLLNTAVKQRDAAAHAPAHAKTEQREHEKPQPERNLGREEFIAKTVIEPGRGLFKRVRDTITDMQGNPVIATERSRMNLGSWSFNVPGTRYNVSNGVPEDQAKALAKKHIQDVSRRN
jgi:hypothetical protein